MKLSGTYSLDAPRERVWPLLFDPKVLMELLPGCEQIECSAPGEYTGRLVLRIPAVSGAYDTHLRIVERVEPDFCRLQGEAGGPSGGVRGEATFRLAPVDGETVVEYQADALISGPLAGMNQRFAEGIGQQLIKQALGRLAARPELQPVIPPPRRTLWQQLGVWYAEIIWRLERLATFHTRWRC